MSFQRFFPGPFNPLVTIELHILMYIVDTKEEYSKEKRRRIKTRSQNVCKKFYV